MMFLNDDPTGRRAFLSALVLVVVGVGMACFVAVVPQALLIKRSNCHQTESIERKDCILIYLSTKR